jgi:hypothetical protein
MKKLFKSIKNIGMNLMYLLLLITTCYQIFTTENWWSIWQYKLVFIILVIASPLYLYEFIKWVKGKLDKKKEGK